MLYSSIDKTNVTVKLNYTFSQKILINFKLLYLKSCFGKFDNLIYILNNNIQSNIVEGIIRDIISKINFYFS